MLRSSNVRDRENTVVLSTDDMIDACAAVIGKTYSDVFETVDLKQFERKMMEDFEHAIEWDKSIIVDRTNMTAKSRARFLSRIPEHYRKIAVAFEVNRDILMKRLKDRETTGKIIPTHVIENMIERYEPPTRDEFDIIKVIT